MNPINYEPSHSAVYYTPPRKFDPSRTFTGLVGAILAVVVGGAVYSLILPLITSVKLRMLAVLVASIVAGSLSRGVIKHGRICIPVFATAIGAFLGILAVYVMWLTFVLNILSDANSTISAESLILHPDQFLRIIGVLLKVGTFKLGHDQVTGFPLLIIWLIEAGGVLGTSVIMAVKAIGLLPVVCSSCKKDCKQACRPARYSVNQQDEMIAAIYARDFEFLRNCPGREHDDDPELGLRLLSCPDCAKTNVLSLTRIFWGADKRGKPVVVSKPLVDQLLITPEEAEKVKTLSPDYKPQELRDPEQSIE